MLGPGARALARVEEAVAAPALAQEPAGRGLDRQELVAARDAEARVARPAVERDRARVRIEDAAAAAIVAVLAPVVEDVREGVARAARRGDRVGVVAIADDASLAADDLVEAPGERDLEGADAA